MAFSVPELREFLSRQAMLLLMIASMVILSGCGVVEFGRDQEAKNNAKTSGDSGTQNNHNEHDCSCHDDDDDNDNNNDKVCETIEFTQEGSSTNDSLDVVFMVDTSDSFDAERAGVNTALANFISGLPEGLDLNVGVLLAHGSLSPYSGSLFEVSTEGLSLESSVLTRAEIITALNTKLSNTVRDDDSDGGEMGLFATLQATNFLNLPILQANNLFRDGTPLLMVYVSDEDAICSTTVPFGDKNTDELPAFIRDCEGVLPIGAYNRLISVKGADPVLIGGVYYTGESSIPADGENSQGFGYEEVVAAAGANGVGIDLAGGNISTGLDQLAGTVLTNLVLQTEFSLDATGIDSADITGDGITVTVDGEEVGFSYNPTTNTVTLESAGEQGSVIVIEVCVNDGNNDDDDDGGDDDDDCKDHHKKRKVKICHIPSGDLARARTLRVAAPAVPAHLRHGDRLGPCYKYDDIVDAKKERLKKKWKKLKEKWKKWKYHHHGHGHH